LDELKVILVSLDFCLFVGTSEHFGDTVGTPTPKDDESSATDYVKAETPKKSAMPVYQSCRM
jgi:hypothetical protein